MRYNTRIFIYIALFIFLSVRYVLAKDLSLAPNFRLENIQHHEAIALDDYKDKQPVLLFFWTSWCPFCIRELNSLNTRYASLVKDGVELLAINVSESAYKVDRLIKGYGLAVKVLLDEDGEVARSYGVFGVPTYVFIDKKGYIIFQENYFPQEKYKNLIAK